MQVRRLVPVLALLAAACGPKASSATPPPAPAAPTCADAARAGSAAIVADLTRAPTEAQRAELERGIEAACAEDAWSPELVACVAAITPATDDSCQGLLTEAQNEGMFRRLADVMRVLLDGEPAKERTYDFEDDPVEGDLIKPDGDSIDDGAWDPCEGGE